MSIDTVTERCASIQQDNIDGVKTALDFKSTPNDLKSVKLPLFTNFPMTTEYAPAGTGHAYETATYQMVLWIEPIARPADAARKAKLFGEFMPRIRDAFLARPGLGGLQGVREAKLTTIAQPQVQSYAGTDYLTIAATLQVVEQVNVVYADGD